MSIGIQKFTADELDSEKLDWLILGNHSFQVVAVGDISAWIRVAADCKSKPLSRTNRLRL
ncbi:hypothetical protein D7S83_21330 [Ralstonia pickettii]|jgi:hypothetical protein|nr:hypothetical protein [Ralstonia pickettii]MBB0099191.1 hypothetical protein [Ralstonia pickettii]MBB0109113.1 hypothetical protein [Ralstonia pickettii]MBB0207151.1 hypothetical protein [Ralstonia pickettii]